MKTREKKLPLVYIAGPFTASQPWRVEANIRRAEDLGHDILAKCGANLSLVIPHSIGRAFIGTMWSDYWYEATMAMLERCDAVVLVPGWQKSRGTKREIARAHKLGIPVFSRVADLRRWSMGVGA